MCQTVQYTDRISFVGLTIFRTSEARGLLVFILLILGSWPRFYMYSSSFEIDTPVG